MKPVHLAIAIPGESMPMEAVRCFGRLLLMLSTRGPAYGIAQVSQSMFGASMLPYARAKVIEQALEGGATHVLCLDTDMTYPANVVFRLLGHRRPFVACNAMTRRPPIRWVARDKSGEVIRSGLESGLTKASVVGLAVALIERRVFEAIPAPRFNFEYTENGWRGEDVWFCDRALEAGFQPMVDNSLSREIGHLGIHEYKGD